jgi:hypothetical protein
MLDGLSNNDFEDAAIKDADELISDGTRVKFSFSIVSTTSSTKTIVISGLNLLYKDYEIEPGDILQISGSTAADGYYTANTITDETSFTVNESILSSTGGDGYIIYPSGANFIGVNTSGINNLSSTDNTVQKAISKLDTVITSDRTNHPALRQLIHLSENGPFEGFTSGAYKETIGGVFPTSAIWWESAAKLKKIVEVDITYNVSKTINTITWKSYDASGTLLASFTDTISYSGIIETSRTRVIN